MFSLLKKKGEKEKGHMQRNRPVRRRVSCFLGFIAEKWKLWHVERSIFTESQEDSHAEAKYSLQEKRKEKINEGSPTNVCRIRRPDADAHGENGRDKCTPYWETTARDRDKRKKVYSAALRAQIFYIRKLDSQSKGGILHHV